MTSLKESNARSTQRKLYAEEILSILQGVTLSEVSEILFLARTLAEQNSKLDYSGSVSSKTNT